MNVQKSRYRIGLLMPMIGLTLVLMLQSQTTNPKVDNFLRSLSTFPTAKDASVAFQAARFTDTERRQLENQLRNPIYKPTIDRLIGTVTKEAARKMRPVPKSIASRKQSQALMIENRNNQIKASSYRLLTAPANVSGTAQAVVGAAPKITSLSHPDISPGGWLKINGTGFLPQGIVQFTFGANVYDGIVENWADDSIIVRMPSGIKGLREMEGNVTVRKQNRMQRADAVIRFIPTWDYQELTSRPLSEQSPQWDPVAAFCIFIVRPDNMWWCADFRIEFTGYASDYRFKNGWVVDGFIYVSDVDMKESDDADPEFYNGWDELPERTEWELCHGLFNPGKIYMKLFLKGPLGLSY